MVKAGRTRKKKGAARPGKNKLRLVLAIAGGVLVALTGLFILNGLQPETSPPPPALEDFVGAPPIVYEEEMSVPETPPGVGKGEKSRVAGGREKAPVKEKLPRVAIVIDDMGYQQKTCEGLLDLNLNLSFAFLPFGPYTEKQAAEAKRRGRNVLLHFPMEPADPGAEPGPGAVTIAMNRQQISRIFKENLASVPSAAGINNHMGSRFTQNAGAMRDFMTSVRASGLFFLDSRTSQNTVAYFTAQEMGVRSAKRDVFLDNVRDRKKIIIQLRKLLGTAQRHGMAIGIGHPYPETLAALKEFSGEMLGQVEVVGVGELVN